MVVVLRVRKVNQVLVDLVERKDRKVKLVQVDLVERKVKKER